MTDLAVHTTQNAIPIEADGQLKPKAETSTEGFGSFYRDDADDQHYVFFSLGDSDYASTTTNPTKAFVFNLDRLLNKYKAIVRFEDANCTYSLNKISKTNFDIDGVTGAQAYSMIEKTQHCMPTYVCELEIMVKGSVNLSDLVSTR